MAARTGTAEPSAGSPAGADGRLAGGGHGNGVVAHLVSPDRPTVGYPRPTPICRRWRLGLPPIPADKIAAAYGEVSGCGLCGGILLAAATSHDVHQSRPAAAEDTVSADIHCGRSALMVIAEPSTTDRLAGCNYA